MIPVEVFLIVTFVSLAAIIVIAVRMTDRMDHNPQCMECRERRKNAVFAATEAKRVAAEKQAELAHESEHRGWGYSSDSPDLYTCSRIACPRNKQ